MVKLFHINHRNPVIQSASMSREVLKEQVLKEQVQVPKIEVQVFKIGA